MAINCMSGWLQHIISTAHIRVSRLDKGQTKNSKYTLNKVVFIHWSWHLWNNGNIWVYRRPTGWIKETVHLKLKKKNPYPYYKYISCHTAPFKHWILCGVPLSAEWPQLRFIFSSGCAALEEEDKLQPTKNLAAQKCVLNINTAVNVLWTSVYK